MVCKLCHLEKELVPKSHILTNFLYKDILSQNMLHVDLETLKVTGKRQSGIHESNLLCSNCENKILGGSIERYASLTIYNKTSNLPWKVRRGFVNGEGDYLPCLRYENIDCSKIKLFFLAQLWRAHISIDPFFEEVDLGEKHSEIIRKMLLEGDSLSDDDYQVSIIALNTDDLRASRSIVTPIKIRKNGNVYYIIHIDKFTCLINISRFNPSSIFRNCIKNIGTFDITLIPQGYSNKFFDFMIGKAPNFNYGNNRFV